MEVSIFAFSAVNPAKVGPARSAQIVAERRPEGRAQRASQGFIATRPPVWIPARAGKTARLPEAP